MMQQIIIKSEYNEDEDGENDRNKFNVNEKNEVFDSKGLLFAKQLFECIQCGNTFIQMNEAYVHFIKTHSFLQFNQIHSNTFNGDGNINDKNVPQNEENTLRSNKNAGHKNLFKDKNEKKWNQMILTNKQNESEEGFNEEEDVDKNVNQILLNCNDGFKFVSSLLQEESYDNIMLNKMIPSSDEDKETKRSVRKINEVKEKTHSFVHYNQIPINTLNEQKSTCKNLNSNDERRFNCSNNKINDLKSSLNKYLLKNDTHLNLVKNNNDFNENNKKKRKGGQEKNENNDNNKKIKKSSSNTVAKTSDPDVDVIDNKRGLIKSKEKSFKCGFENCNKSYTRKENLNLHRKKHVNAVKCEWPRCKMIFSDKNQLMAHFIIHTKARNPCDWPGCEYSSRFLSGLIQHKRVHSREKPYKCHWPGCNQQFAQKSTLCCHIIRKHEMIKRFTCEWPGCEMKFMVKHQVKRHMRTHTGERPYACEWPDCGRKFNDLGALHRHKFTHTGERPYHCDWPGCDARFGATSSLGTHKKLVHKCDYIKRSRWDNKKKTKL